jgi:hypothetical protein
MVVNEVVPSPQQVLTNFFGLLPVNPGQLVQPLRTSGRIGIGTFDAQPQATLEVRSGEGFEDPQVQIVQTTPSDFARLRFVSTVLSTGDPEAPHPRRPVPTPFWDIAVGGGFDDVMNLFHQHAGNVMTLTPAGNVGVGVAEPAARLDVAGTARVAVLEITGGADVAEPFAVVDTAEPGDVMVIDEQHPGSLKVSHAAYDYKVAGIVSGAGGLAPGVVLGAGDAAVGQVRVALSGRT